MINRQQCQLLQIDIRWNLVNIRFTYVAFDLLVRKAVVILIFLGSSLISIIIWNPVIQVAICIIGTIDQVLSERNR